MYSNHFWTDCIRVSIEEKRLELITRNYVSIISLDKVTRLEYYFSSTIFRSSVAAVSFEGYLYYIFVSFVNNRCQNEIFHRPRNNCFPFAFEWIWIILN